MFQYDVSYDDDDNRTVEAAYFTGENYITGQEASVYFLTGHGEKTLSGDYTKFNQNMTNRNYNAQELNLATASAIPEDAAILILAAPQNDISNDETRMINEYLDNGGNICFLMSPNEKKVDYKNIESIMNDFGICMDYDIVKETDSSRYVSGDPYTYQVSIVRANTQDDPDAVDITSELADLTDNGYYAFMSNSRSFYQSFEAEDYSLEVGSLLQTVSDTDELGNPVSTAIGEVYGGTDPAAETIEGAALDLAMYSTSSSRNDAKMIVMGNAEFIDDENVSQDYMIIPVYLMLSAMSWMHDSDLVLDMGIAEKERDYDSMNLNSETAANTTMIVFITVPVVVGLVGVGVWLKRRYS